MDWTTKIPAKKHKLKVVSVFLLLFLLVGCAKRITFLTSSVVPAARGSVKVTKDKNNNYNINLDLFNLSEPERLQPSKKTYVVWMITDRNVTKNIGQLTSSSKLLSRQIKAKFTTVSPSKPSKIFLTAEDDGSVQNPGTQVVITTNNF